MAAALANVAGSDGPRNVLSVGSGEILPYIIRRWEDRSTQLTCVDLSQRSLNRARFRCLLTGGQTTFYRADINELLETPEFRDQRFDHIEAYGVLHHISNFDETVRKIARHLKPNATMRIMVYNADARGWIWQANRAFRNLGLKYENDRDVDAARNILKALATKSKRLDERLAQMGRQSLDNNSRFADTFLHPWESRLDVSGWIETFKKHQLSPVALFDRYGELDDLENPLWSMPSNQQLLERCKDLRFENNLEIWLRRSDAPLNHSPDPNAKPVPARFKFLRPPTIWSRFPECKALPPSDRWLLWQGWIKAVYGHQDSKSIALIKKLPLPTAQRLARLGAITCNQATWAGNERLLRKPIHPKMDVPVLALGLDMPQVESALSNALPQTLPNPNGLTAAKARLQRIL